MEIYFGNIQVLQNTLFPYFCNPYPLISLNKKLSTLNYEKYNTHLQPHGTTTTYYPETKIIESTKNYKNGKLHGLYENYNKNGKIIQRWNYLNNQLDGLYELWHDTQNDEIKRSNGQLKHRSNYKNDQLDGLYEIWYPNGQLEHRCNYVNDQLDGIYELWYENGEAWPKFLYKNGQLEHRIK